MNATLSPAVAEAIQNISVTGIITRQVTYTCSVSPNVFCESMGRLLSMESEHDASKHSDKFKEYFVSLSEDEQLALVKLFSARCSDVEITTDDSPSEEVDEEITLDEFMDSYKPSKGWDEFDSDLFRSNYKQEEVDSAASAFKTYCEPLSQVDEVSALRQELEDLKRKHALLVSAVQETLHKAKQT